MLRSLVLAMLLSSLHFFFPGKSLKTIFNIFSPDDLTRYSFNLLKQRTGSHSFCKKKKIIVT